MTPDSKLATKLIQTPNYSTRQGKIMGIIPHCMAGQMTAEACANMFARPARQASANYCIGPDGVIVQSCLERYRAWTSGGGKTTPNGWTGAKMDHWCVTIEVASDNVDPYYCTDAAWASLVELCVDICQRNNIPELRWRADPALSGEWNRQNLGAHRWYDYRACPGDYMYGRFGELAETVSARLEASRDMTREETLSLIQEVTPQLISEYLSARANELRVQGIPEWAEEQGEYQAAVDEGITDGSRPMSIPTRMESSIMAKRAENGATRRVDALAERVAKLEEALEVQHAPKV